MPEQFFQCELVRQNADGSETHRVGWYSWGDLQALPPGWTVLHRYENTIMIRNKEGRLKPIWSLDFE